jgi:hypothetical protein
MMTEVTNWSEQDYHSALMPPVQAVAAWDVVEVMPLPGHRLAVRFVDGLSGIVDLSARVVSPTAGVFERLRDVDVFAQVYIAYGAVTWPREIDLAPDAMHDEIKARGVWRVA